MTNQGHNFTKEEQRKGGEHSHSESKQAEKSPTTKETDGRKNNTGHHFTKEEQSKGGKNS